MKSRVNIHGEIEIGTIIGGHAKGKPSLNCHGYSEDLPSVTWDDLLKAIAKFPSNDPFQLMFLGQFYPGDCGAREQITTKTAVQRNINPYWGEPGQPVGPKAVTTDPAMTGTLVGDLFNLQQAATHIVGILIRRI